MAPAEGGGSEPEPEPEPRGGETGSRVLSGVR